MRPAAGMVAARAAAIALCVFLHAAGAAAQEARLPAFSFDGYGTLGVVGTGEDHADFVSDWFVPEGAGYTREWSAQVDSRLGLQLTAELTPRLTALGQVVVAQDHRGSFRPEVEWANVAFDLTPELTVRVGRSVSPTFLTSEYAKVGYALPWIRQPPEVRRVMPVLSLDGMDISHRSRVGEVTNTFRAAYGSRDTRTPGHGTLRARQAYMLTNTLEWGGTELLASYSSVRVTMDGLNPLFDAFRAFGPEGEAIGDRFDIDGKRFNVVSLGARHDAGDWFAMAEWVHSHSRTFAGRGQGGYVTGGLRFGPLAPYVTLARLRARRGAAPSGLSLDGLPPPVAAAAGGLNAALNELLASVPQQSSVAVGARWDFAQTAALKVQFDRLDLADGSPGVMINEQPGFRRGGNVSLFSVAVDFVF